jgi:hypothetical protein
LDEAIVDLHEQQQPQQQQQQQPQQTSKIPRFIRKTARSHSSGSSPVERKLKVKIA